MLPTWLKKAVKQNVVSLSEAQEIHEIALACPDEEIQLPEHLWPAAERISLWETSCSKTLH